MQGYNELVDEVKLCHDNLLKSNIMLSAIVKYNRIDSLNEVYIDIKNTVDSLNGFKIELDKHKKFIPLDTYNEMVSLLDNSLKSFDDVYTNINDIHDQINNNKEVNLNDLSKSLLKSYDIMKEFSAKISDNEIINSINKNYEEFNSEKDISSHSDINNDVHIDHTYGESYNKEVLKTRIEQEINTVTKQIGLISSKERLSVLDKIKLTQLEENLANLNDYLNKITKKEDKGIIASRERKLDNTEDKIDYNNTKVQNISNREYETRIFNAIKNKRVELLEKKLESLREKRGVIMGKQKSSALHSFDLKNRFIKLKSNVKGLVSGTKQVVKDSFSKAKNGISSFIVDVSRFASYNGELDTILNRLKNKKGVIVMTSPMLENSEQMKLSA